MQMPISKYDGEHMMCKHKKTYGYTALFCGWLLMKVRPPTHCSNPFIMTLKNTIL